MTIFCRFKKEQNHFISGTIKIVNLNKRQLFIILWKPLDYKIFYYWAVII